MPIDPTKPADGVAAVKGDLRANLQAAKEGIEGDTDTNTGTSATITNTQFGANGDSQDYLFIHNHATNACDLTLGTGVPVGKSVHVFQADAGVVNVQATNVATGAFSTTTQYDSLVFRVVDTDTWARFQLA